ncbi:hypothetical protein GJ496_010033 [Pomphorhynchus laevis]|nr:hypothetical protein GJ496_010033 [Pomphorhynchus laevis]
MVPSRRNDEHRTRHLQNVHSRNSVLRVLRSVSCTPVSKRRKEASPNSRSSLKCNSKIRKHENRRSSSSPEIPNLHRKENDSDDRASPELPLMKQICEPLSKNKVVVNKKFVASKSKKTRNETADKSEKYTKLIPDYFPLRKSQRLDNVMDQLKMKKQIEHSWVEAVLLNSSETGFVVRNLPDKGRAVFANRVFQKDDFVLEYVGTLRSVKEARQCEKVYAENNSLGCFMFYFKYLCKSYCMDATEETRRLGRLVNHSRYRNNLIPKIVSINGYPHLILIASKRIDVGDELLYDYGDRSVASLRAHPWLAT